MVLSAALCLPRGTEGHLRSWLLSKIARLPNVTSLWQPCLPDLDLPEVLNSSFCCLCLQQIVSPNPKELSAVCALRKRHQQSPIWEVWSGEQTKLDGAILTMWREGNPGKADSSCPPRSRKHSAHMPKYAEGISKSLPGLGGQFPSPGLCSPMES